MKDSLEESFVSEAEAEINEDTNVRRRRDTSDILKEVSTGVVIFAKYSTSPNIYTIELIVI